MLMVPCAFWPLAEHAAFGQNCFDASIGSVSVCICYSMPMDACFFNYSFPFHRIVGFYRIVCLLPSLFCRFCRFYCTSIFSLKTGNTRAILPLAEGGVPTHSSCQRTHEDESEPLI